MFFGKSKKQTARKPMSNKPRNSVVREQRPRNTFVAARARKIAASRFANIIKIATLGGIGVAILVVFFGIFGILAFSLKSKSTPQFIIQVQNFIKSTPLGSFIKTTEQPVQEMVVGVADVPAYPGSEFVFQDLLQRNSGGTIVLNSQEYTQDELQSIYTFLSSGQSVYRLPLDVDWHSVTTYYQQVLPQAGWSFAVSVPVTDLSKVPGEYYVKGTKGLHLYTISNDIWYETVSKDEATSGLHDKIAAYQAKEQLVQAASGQDVPQSTWWQLRYSRDWTLATTKHPIYGEDNLVFTQDQTKARISILIVDRYRGQMADLDYKYLETTGTQYVINWLSTQQTSVTLNGFTKNELLIGDTKALEFADTKHNAYFLFTVNKYNSLVYCIQYFGDTNADFYAYIKANLKAVKAN